jgi:hypothetical protein
MTNKRAKGFFSSLSFQILRRLLASVLIVAIGPTPALLAQAAAIGQSTGGSPMSLHITILDGEDAVNSIRERTAREPIVQVEDENHKPVAGVLILFSVDSGPEGAAGSFSGLSSTLSVTTGADGRAVAHGLLPNRTPGKYTVTVSATLGALVATAIIHQTNIAGVPGESSSSETGTQGTSTQTTRSHIPGRFARIPKKYWAIGGGVIIVGTVLAVTLTTGNSGTTITPGSGSVGGP